MSIKPSESNVTADSRELLRRFTLARVALGHTGTSLPTRPHLDFQLAHARARDAVHHPLDVENLGLALSKRDRDFMVLHSAAADRHIYLQRPDQGRRLNEASRASLQQLAASRKAGCDVALVIADGLSALAIERNAMAFVDVILPAFSTAAWSMAPIAIVEQGRVAVGDEIGETLGAQGLVILIGERPGLSSSDSMGIYFTYRPRVEATDAERNCISNIRPGGLSYAEAADKLFYLMQLSRTHKMSGVLLKDNSEAPRQAVNTPRSNFLLSRE